MRQIRAKCGGYRQRKVIPNSRNSIAREYCLGNERSWGIKFFVDGLRSFELKEWTIMEGTLGLSVNFSDPSVELA